MGADITRKVLIDAPAVEVFPYFTQPDKMITWHARSASVDGGRRFRVDVNGGPTAVGEFVTIEPPHRVVFTWGWEGGGPMPPGSTTVEVTLREVGEMTEVTLVHRGIPASERAGNSAGWDHYLPRLKRSVETGDAGPDTWASTA